MAPAGQACAQAARWPSNLKVAVNLSPVQFKSRALVGIVTNNLLEEQQDKLRQCALDGYVDELVVSEKAGMSKPDPRIFEIALDRLGCHRDEAAMVGDSWPADVAGAIAATWLA